MAASALAVTRYKRQLSVYRNRTATLLAAAWSDLPGYDEAQVELFELRTRPALAGAKTAAVALSAGFFSVALGTRPVAVTARAVEVEAKTRAPFLATWHALSQQRSFEEAVGAGRSAAEAAAFDFVQSVARRTGDHVATASGRRVRWRRVPGGSSCTWCVEMAGSTYSSAESADFGHDRCDCDAVPA